MEFDFYRLYATCSNKELLRILALPDQYQPAAVAAAKNILAGRQVTAAEQEAVAAELHGNIEEEIIIEPREAEKEFSIFDEEGLPQETLQLARKWALVIVLAACSVMAINLYYALSSLFYLIRIPGLLLSPFTLINTGVLIFNVLVITLFLKGRSWGWLLMTFLTGYSIAVNGVALLYALLAGRFTGSISLLLIMVIRFVAGYFLLQGSLMQIYGITAHAMKRTIVITAVASGTQLLAVWLLQHSGSF